MKIDYFLAINSFFSDIPVIAEEVKIQVSLQQGEILELPCVSAPNPMSSAGSGNCRLMGVNWRVFCALMNTMDDEMGSVKERTSGWTHERMKEGVFNWPLVLRERPTFT